MLNETTLYHIANDVMEFHQENWCYEGNRISTIHEVECVDPEDIKITVQTKNGPASFEVNNQSKVYYFLTPRTKEI
tara:strand:+ start:474 stop:701 length:228 start_codon:yes stop_codon:yes gene_type:complete